MSYLIYLRKSRADLEAEARGEGETLARHEETLLALAKRKNLNIGGIYREIVSGESIAARPQMQKLLEEVDNGQWEGVLVMEVERLARGNTMDQGIVSNAFTNSCTVIITPTKTYDPTNEFDQEYFEFSLFMSRREYKTIRRRMEAGRIAAVKEGCFIGNVPPYGYDKYRRDDGKYSLKINPEEAENVKYIFESRAEGKSMTEIANALTDSGIPTRKGAVWQHATIRDMISNPVYKGCVRWYNRYHVKNPDNTVSNKRVRSLKSKDIIIAQGLHEPIVSVELWEKANAVVIKKSPSYCDKPLSNPLAGLIICKECGHSMIVRHFHGSDDRRLICVTHGCRCRGTTEDILTNTIAESLNKAYQEYKHQSEAEEIESSQHKKLKTEIKNAKNNLIKLEARQQKLYELLETGVYTPEVFVERQKKLEEEIQSAKSRIMDLENSSEVPETDPAAAAQKIKYLIDTVSLCETPKAKNKLYKSVIKRIVYYREPGNGKYSNPPIDIDIEFNF